MTVEMAVSGALVGFTRCTSTAISASNPLDANNIAPNYGLNTPDEAQRVKDFRETLSKKLGSPAVWMQQTHSDVVATVPNATYNTDNSVAADAVIVPAGVIATVQVADCVPVIIVDSRLKIAAAAHAGRAGIEKEILAETIQQMQQMGSQINDLAAAVGPCICEKCYEVGPDVYEKYVGLFPQGASETSWGTPSINLRKVVTDQLMEQGITEIIQDETCTLEADDLNSYRQNPHCGRQIGWVLFPNP
ncbi:conserved hypothetical protein, YfiH family [Gleimia coleocanis DSM 15436]|uniref:Purine nucleoside phosphorylase n=1 Tax=Gleimia coleocanis DSM 15436 TaxID=525245 RepID=C0VZB6_9ACTO|nr:peptidoglycan editing factor PgeF [Gleimia coleocanis]EEH64217.1 conserved hypothetical protein, YfiH family [Gleimia coleocanis DSM 15436]